GAFTPSAEGELMNSDGHRLLDEGGGPIIIPAGASAVAVGQDGTLSANGVQFGRIGVFAPPEGDDPLRQGGTLFSIAGAPEPVETATIRQGFLEESNVDPVFEITRMIEVQRNYELGQSFLEREDQRIRAAITAMTR
ncbi:MAG: flagellar basal body rod C-terminal domain-containing protein, partial [Pararhodobacter sp.]